MSPKPIAMSPRVIDLQNEEVKKLFDNLASKEDVNKLRETVSELTKAIADLTKENIKWYRAGKM